MDDVVKKQIERSNREEAQRARTGMAGRDWAIVLGSVLVIAAIFSFLYFNDAGTPNTADIEPAAGSAAAPAPAYDTGSAEGVGADTPADDRTE